MKRNNVSNQRQAIAYKKQAIRHVIFKLVLCIFLTGILCAINSVALSADNVNVAEKKHVNELERVSFKALPQNTTQIKLYFSKSLRQKPHSFLMNDPDRLIFDFNDIGNQTGKTIHPANIGILDKATTIEADDRFRVMLNLTKPARYTTKVNGKNLIINVNSQQLTDKALAQKKFDYGAAIVNQRKYNVKDIDFRRSDKSGRIIITLSDPDTVVDVSQEGDHIIANFPKTNIPSRLQRRLDVTDFGTPVTEIDVIKKGEGLQMRVNSKGHYEYLAYHVGNQFFIDVSDVKETSNQSKQKQEYTGKRLSLNFQDIEIRSVLQLLAEFTGLNIVVSDDVKGSITLRLTDVPWDQALAIILQTRGLGKEQIGNVMLIAPIEEITKREKQALESLKQVEILAPLKSMLIQLNYARAADMVELLKAKGNSILSDRGSVSFDARTNSLWVQDTGSQITEVIKFVKQLDIPVRQVLIEARIVEVEKNYEEDLGVRLGISNPENNITGTLAGANEIANNTPIENIDVDNRLNVNLPAVASAAAGDPTTFGIALARLGSDTFLDLELSALETEGRGKVISAPRVITSDQQTARIESGEEIPYQESTSSGATSISFKKAVLSLEVTPQITPDSQIIMELKVNKDSRGTDTIGTAQEPPINTKSVETKVLVKNGETIVLGGIYDQTKTLNISKTPFLGDIPILGYAFRRKSEVNDRSELLIFITPKIIMQEGIV